MVPKPYNYILNLSDVLHNLKARFFVIGYIFNIIYHLLHRYGEMGICRKAQREKIIPCNIPLDITTLSSLIDILLVSFPPTFSSVCRFH